MTDAGTVPSEVPSGPLLLRAAGVAVLLDQPGLPGGKLPQVLHWGSDPGPLTDAELAKLATDLKPGVNHNALDEPPEFSLSPGQPEGWLGRPGLAGHRDGADPFPRFRVTGSTVTPEADGGTEVVITAADQPAGLSLTIWLRLEATGIVRTRTEVTNTGSGDYTVDGVTALLPVPDEATEVLDLTGRWCRERSPQRQPFHQGSRVRESRRGRTGHDATLLLAVGPTGFGFRSGQVWAVHAAWSGNHVHLAERLPGGAGPGGDRVIGAGELLLPGEIRLAPGTSYRSPWIVFAWSERGLDGVSARLHQSQRSRPGHPSRPRPLVLNTWEAVYFRHDDHETLWKLAEQAADIGVERFVLDDGWFRGRRDDTAGLGDWFVDPAVWPDGLRPLADRVRELGMEFGLWFEPEMANPDSDLVREHPDWVLAAAGRWPTLSRNQLVIDVANPQAYQYLLDRIDTLVGELQIGYLKWDHNRDLVEAIHAGAPGVHEQTAAVYRLLEELRQRRPGLEIESCSSGGARVDLGILEHTDRVWASDTNDPLERQPIQRWTSTLIPPELIGAHVGPRVAHTTNRASDLSFRCATALFGHAGIEWDITSCTPEERVQLTEWARLYRELRPLLHSGEVVRADQVEEGIWVHGVVAHDRSEAVYAYLRLETSPSAIGGRIRLPGLDPQTQYSLTRRDEIGTVGVSQRSPSNWWQAGTASARGSVLEQIGLPAPALNPGQAIVLHLRAQ
ncbi:MAG TPA: alpha-galactosidase [Kineosporiaceae bacterium]|nr:alpha-galactosidase [Kineosporiaceae bacterium]